MSRGRELFIGVVKVVIFVCIGLGCFLLAKRFFHHEELKIEKTLIIIVGHAAQYARLNLIFFKDFGVLPGHPNYDFIFVINGKYRFDLPKHYTNVKVLYKDEKGFDFNAWAYGFRSANKENYKYFMFINGGIRGPFLPPYMEKEEWPRFFTRQIDDSVKLVGILLNYDHVQVPENIRGKKRLNNIHKLYHLQSMLWATDLTFTKIGLEQLLFQSKIETKIDTYAKEWILSITYLQNGYQIKPIVWSQLPSDFQNIETKKYMDHSLTRKIENIPCRLQLGFNQFLPWCHLGMNPNLFDSMFIKTHDNAYFKPEKLNYATSQYTRWMYQKKLGCRALDVETQGATCATTGGSLYRDKDFQCAYLEPSLLLNIEGLGQFLGKYSIESVVDIGGGYGVHCAELKAIQNIECYVLEPAPLFDCMHSDVIQIQGDVLSPNLNVKESFDVGMLIDTLDWLNQDRIDNLYTFLENNIRRFVIITPPNKEFASSMIDSGFKIVYQSRIMEIFERLKE